MNITSLEQLYSTNLVIVSEYRDAIVEKKAELVSISYTGGFKRKILWLHTESMHPFLSDDDHEMVSKILDACRLSWDDIALINLDKSTQTAGDIVESLAPFFIISSVPSSLYNMTHPALYQLTETAGIKTTYTDTLAVIRNDKNLKIKFWHALKIMFEL